METITRVQSQYTWAAIAIFGSFIVLLLAFRSSLEMESSTKSRLFTVGELALYNGSDDALPILLAILGSVFDVSKGKSHYGARGSYNHFAGRDASRAFVSGNFSADGLTDSLIGLSSIEVHSVVQWRDFYLKSYTLVGKVVGRYYDDNGRSTKSLEGAKAKGARGAQILEEQKREEATQTSCNSRWTHGDGGEVWCDEGFPRLVERAQGIALTGKISRRCACFGQEQLGRPDVSVYDGCAYHATRCHV